jgi:ethylbenzene dioxygenase ferredoxin subunit
VRTPIRLCAAEAVIEGLPLRVELPGRPPLAVFKVGSAYYATDGTCTHGNARLTDGCQQGATVRCPLHGGAFDIATGRPVAPPCRMPLATHPIAVSDGAVFLL